MIDHIFKNNYMCLAMVLDNVISILVEKFAFFNLHFLLQLLA